MSHAASALMFACSFLFAAAVIGAMLWSERGAILGALRMQRALPATAGDRVVRVTRVRYAARLRQQAAPRQTATLRAAA